MENQKICSKKVKPEEQEYKKRTYQNLIHFIKLGLTDSVKFLFNNNHDNFFDLSLRDSNGYTLLSLAIAVDKEELFDYLIEKGFSVSDEVKNGSNILHVAAYLGRFTFIHKIIEKDSSLLNLRSYSGKTPLYYACENGFYLATFALLKAGANPNIADNYGRTPLHISSSSNKRLISKTLISFGCNTNAENELGLTPIMTVCGLKNWEMLYFLAENNCDINYISTNVITNIINILSLFGEDEIIQKLLTDYNLRFDDNHRYSPIYVACSKNNFSTMSLLFKHGAKVCIHTKELIKEKLTREIPENCEKFRKFLKETNTILQEADEYQELVSFLDEIFVSEGDVTFFENDESFIGLLESNFDVVEESRPRKRIKN
tara:strand:+ start:494 stop:1612 length:1119 start_codon:yes stop_codon:yes gene_type:complete